jgi:hypothetical protein
VTLTPEQRATLENLMAAASWYYAEMDQNHCVGKADHDANWAECEDLLTAARTAFGDDTLGREDA